MCDDTGLFQHAVHSVPDRAHGYCVDDNARALLLACALNNPGEKRLSEVLTARFAAFVQHAWNPDTNGFAISWASIEAGLKTAAPKTAMGEHCGRWASAHARMQARRDVDGLPPCLPRHCQLSKPLVRPAHWPSPCWVWTAIAPLLPMIAAAREIRRHSCRHVDVGPCVGRDAGLVVVRGRPGV